MSRPHFAAALLLALSVFLRAPLFGADLPSPQPPAPSPLHSRIDFLLESAAIGPLAPLCTDSDFVRRIYLDLNGVIPTADQARAFVEDRSPAKRERLIDDLLVSPAFTRHLTITLDLILMQRLPEKVVKQPEWEAYLYNTLAADKPLDQLYRELLSADGADPVLRPAAKFSLDRDAEPNLLTRDIGRLVFGLDLQCCQCHDHPLINDYYQDDYYGLFAFVHRTGLFTDTKTKLVSLTEKAEGEASFKSVFTGASSDKALPRLPKGEVLFVEPTFAKGTEYTVKPEKDVRGIPKFSRRAALAEMLPSSREFSRNLANRLWAAIFGRGLVHPLDFHYAGNPPSNPPLLTLLSDELSAGHFQLRPFLRELVLTRAYQRSVEPARPDTLNFADIAAHLGQLKRDKDQFQKSPPPLEKSLANSKAAFKSARDADAALVADLPKLEKSVANARQALEKLAAQRRAAEEIAATIRQQSQTIAAAAEKLATAAQALPDDQTLAAAVQQITAQSTHLTEIAAKAATVTNQPPTGQADAAQDLATAEAALAAAIAKRPTVSNLRQLETAQLITQHDLADANYSLASCDAQIAAAQAILDYASLAKSNPEKAAAAWSSIVEKWTINNQVAALKPLTPEQFAASAMQATGMFAPQVASAAAKLDKTPPDALKKAADADKPRLRSNLTQLELLTQLRPTFTEFIRQYGGLPGEEFQATVNQALFFGNGNTIDAWLKPSGDNLIARLAKIDDSSALIDDLYWSLHSRPPTDPERRAAADYLQNRPSDKPVALSELAWALLSSTEFRFNH